MSEHSLHMHRGQPGEVVTARAAGVGLRPRSSRAGQVEPPLGEDCSPQCGQRLTQDLVSLFTRNMFPSWGAEDPEATPQEGPERQKVWQTVSDSCCQCCTLWWIEHDHPQLPAIYKVDFRGMGWKKLKTRETVKTDTQACVLERV